VIPHLAGTVNNGAPVGQNVGIVANPALMNHIVNIFEAMGFLAIPTAAYMLLFGKAADGLRSNFGSTMSRTIATAATLAAMTAMRSMSKGGGKKPQGKQALGGKGITQGLATNAPSSGGGPTAAAPTAAKAVGGVPTKGNVAHNISGTAPQKSSVAQNSVATKTGGSGSAEGGGATESSESKGTGQDAVTSNQVTAATPSASSQPSIQGGGTTPDSRGPSSGGQVTSNQVTATPSASSQPSIQGGGTAPDSRGRPTGGSIAGNQSVTGPQGRGSAPQAAPQNTAATSMQPQPYQQQRPSIVTNQPKSAGKRSMQKPAVTGRITGYNPKKSS